MDEQAIYQQLESLKQELAKTSVGDDAREKMLGLIDRIEEQMHTPGSADDGISEQFETLVTEFEVSHPTLTGIVNNLLVTLGNMGV
jgi:hypothetical protein